MIMINFVKKVNINNRKKLISFGLATVLSVSFFTSCELSNDDTDSINQTPNTGVATSIDAQPISPEGKAITSLGEADGDVSSILKISNFKISSVGTEKGKFAALKSLPNKYGTLIINVTAEDLANLDELEKTLNAALEQNVTVFLEASKQNRRFLNEVYAKLYANNDNKLDIYAVMLQKFTDGSFAMTPYCKSYNTNLKESLCAIYDIPNNDENELNTKTDVANRIADSIAKKSSQQKGASLNYFVNKTPEWVANHILAREKDDWIESITYVGWNRGGYEVLAKGDVKDVVIVKGEPTEADYNIHKQFTLNTSMTKSESTTKSWSVSLSIGPKIKVNPAYEIAGAASGSYGRSTTVGFSSGTSYGCLYEKNWVEYYIKTVNASDARFKGFVEFDIKTCFVDFNDIRKYTTNRVTIHLNGDRFTPEKFSGIKPITNGAFRYRYSGRLLRK